MTPTAALPAIVKEITINARAERVFDAFVDPDARMRWFGAKGRFRMLSCASDLRVGGAWEFRGESGDGTQHHSFGEYVEIDRPRLVAFTWKKHEWGPEQETLVRVELTERNGVTTLKLTHSGFVTTEDHEDHDEGWTLVLGWMGEYAETGRTAADR